MQMINNRKQSSRERKYEPMLAYIELNQVKLEKS